MTDQIFQVSLVCTSVADDDNVQVEVKWSPDMEGTDIEELGYLPASYRFLQDHILPALTEAFLENMDAPEPTRH